MPSYLLGTGSAAAAEKMEIAMTKANRQFTFALTDGKISAIAEDTFAELQKVVSKILKETGATGISVHAPKIMEDQIRTLFVDSVAQP